jgi:ketosteroid isomerase-like protein
MGSSDSNNPAADFWRAMGDRDVDAAFARVADDAVVKIPSVGILGTAANEGREFFEATMAAFPDLLLTVQKSFTCADGVTVTELKLEGTQAADYLGAINQEKHLDLDQAWLLRVEDGVVRSITGYWDQNTLYRRLAVRRLDQVAIVAG